LTLIDCYLDAFPRTLLVMLLTDEKTNRWVLGVNCRVSVLGLAQAVPLSRGTGNHHPNTPKTKAAVQIRLAIRTLFYNA